ncbi:MAG: glycosyltransferase family 2 protein [Candidatus Omnitrophica bacterium]|nr:glycosyltransferase family 2 protein [Candidatus Omnitrophota bacterium]
MPRPMISVVVIAKNEEHNIDACLGSVHGWADEIIVVDDHSTDKTVELARKYGAKVFSRAMDNEGRHRNWAYRQASTDWVFSLDADERATPELKEEIDGAIESTSHNAFTIPRRNYIGDYWLRYGGQYPAAQLRVFRKTRFRYEEVGVHPRAFLDGTTGHLTKDMIHKSYRDFGHYLAKLNGQSTLEAQKWAETGRKMGKGTAFWRAIDRFFRAYVAKAGWRDGFMGFMVAYLGSVYQIISYAKFYEMVNKQKQEKK